MKKKAGSLFYYYPEPIMDWEKIRLVKMRCVYQCPDFCWWTDGCFGLLPTENCAGFRLQ